MERRSNKSNPGFILGELAAIAAGVSLRALRFHSSLEGNGESEGILHSLCLAGVL
jgi:hypothetical protein